MYLNSSDTKKIRNLQQELANKTSDVSKVTESVQKSQKLEKTLKIVKPISTCYGDILK